MKNMLALRRPNSSLLLLFFIGNVLFAIYNLRNYNTRSDPSAYKKLKCSSSNIDENTIGKHGHKNLPPTDKTITIVKVNYFNKEKFDAEEIGGKLFVPLTFLESKLDWIGEERMEKGEKEWFISKGKAAVIDDAHEIKKYNYKGPFRLFQNYKVENRERVKYIDGVDAVPISTQWSAKGYFYPTQIGQFALSHYTQYLMNSSTATEQVLQDCQDFPSVWDVSEESSYKCINVEGIRKPVMTFSTNLAKQALSLNVKSTARLFTIRLEIGFNGPGAILFKVITKKRGRFSIKYTTDSTEVTVSNRQIVYGVGSRKGLRRITRNLEIDYRKALLLKKLKRRPGKGGKKDNTELSKKHGLLSIKSVVLHGRGYLKRLALVDKANLDFFLDAADWFVGRQDRNGGWAVNVSRRIHKINLTIASGWYSAMAQGHAMSVLTRAYWFTRDLKYLFAAVRATIPLTIPSKKGGVLAKMFDCKIYEEYPAEKPLLVLNGFIYSLFGLYDLKSTVEQVRMSNLTSNANQLFHDGIKALMTILPMYDAGSDTFYDLRHLTFQTEPMIARDSYHALHINQLLILNTVEEQSVFKSIAKRWLEYKHGGRANHN